MFLSDLLQKGVPTNLPLPIELNALDLIGICKNTPELKEQINAASEKFYNLIGQVCDKKTADFFNLKSLNNLEVFIDEETLDMKLIVSTSNIFNKIASLTNEYSIRYYNKEAIDKTIKNLENISEENLKSEYPKLYEYYLHEKEVEASLVQMKEHFKKMDGCRNV